MSTTAESIASSTLGLPESDRLAIVELLMDSLAREATELTDAELEAELDRRFEEFQKDPSAAVA